MRFIVKQAGCGSERVGTLSGFAKSSVAIETPTSALFTKGGSVAHLTVDVLTKVFSEPKLLWVPLSNSMQLEKGARALGEGIAKFSGLPNHVTCCTVNDLNERAPAGHFELDTIPLWTRNGKKKVDAKRYMEVMEAFKPDMILAVADSRTALKEPHKRIVKSVDRTCNLLENCIDRYKGSTQLQNSALIGVIVGASRPRECENCIKRVLANEDELSGIALSGLTEGGEDSIKTAVEQLEPIFKSVSESIPKHLVRILEGCWNPAVVVAALGHGWDVFDGSYAASLSNAGEALALNLGEGHSEELCVLNLNDKCYAEQFTPILDGCDCLCCKKHTRAYIHHLLNTREMLASVLLSIHNLHHFDEMFRVARHHIASKTFQNFKSSITQQYEAYKATQIQKEINDKGNESVHKITKKQKCVSDNNGLRNVVGVSVESA